MSTARVMENGDLRLPPHVARALNAKPGDAVGVEVEADGTVLIRPKTVALEDVFGCLADKTDVKSTVEEMDEAVADAVAHDEP